MALWVPILVAVILIWSWLTWKHKNHPMFKIPGPSYKWPIIGNFFEVIKGDTAEAHTRWAKQYGSTFRYYMMGRFRVMVTDPALIKHVLLSNHLFDKNLVQYQLMSSFLGRGLVTEWDEGIHKYHRSIISPSFAHKHLKGLVPIFQNKGAYLVEDWTKIADTGVPTSIKDDIAKATSDVIGEAAFGYQLNSQRGDVEGSVYKLFVGLVSEGLNLWETIPVIKYFLPAFHRRAAAIAMLDQQVKNIINQKISSRATTNNTSEEESEDNPKKRDLLDIMIDCKNEDGAVLTHAELADQTKTFLLAGYETSSVCILWTMHLLSKHPEIQQRLADEVRSVIGTDKHPSAEDIDKMPYLYKVLRESLRIRPPIPLVVRRTIEDVMLDGYLVPKGTQVVVNIYYQHHNSAVWEKPEEFIPDRWTDDDDEHTRLFGSYLPFIFGPRNCIGSRFAMLEVRIILAMVVQKFSFTKEPGAPEPRTKSRISMVPRTPIKVVFSTRK